MTLMRRQRPEVPSFGAWDEISRLRDELERFFEAPVGGFARGFNVWSPTIDLYEEKDNLILKAELPGMKKEDVELSLHDNTLNISGERKEEKRVEAEPHRTERFYGRFQRSIALPVPVAADKVKASYKDGVLTVSLPKTEEAKPKQIEVQVK